MDPGNPPGPSDPPHGGRAPGAPPVEPPGRAKKKNGGAGAGAGPGGADPDPGAPAKKSEEELRADDDAGLASSEIFANYAPRSVLQWPALAAAVDHPADIAEPVSLK